MGYLTRRMAGQAARNTVTGAALLAFVVAAFVRRDTRAAAIRHLAIPSVVLVGGILLFRVAPTFSVLATVVGLAWLALAVRLLTRERS